MDWLYWTAVLLITRTIAIANNKPNNKNSIGYVSVTTQEPDNKSKRCLPTKAANIVRSGVIISAVIRMIVYSFDDFQDKARHHIIVAQKLGSPL